MEDNSKPTKPEKAEEQIDLEKLETMHLSDQENTILKLAIFGLLHLSKCGAVALGNNLKVIKSLSTYSSQTIKQKEKFVEIASFQVMRLGGPDEFSRYLKKING